MKNYIIDDIKHFMNELLCNEKYDSFYMHEARIKTALDYYISGKINKNFFDNDRMEMYDKQEYILWKDIKNIIYDLMKGERLPISFKIVLMFNNDNIERLIEMNNIPMASDDITALFINIYYENNELLLTTGTSVKIFTLDKSLEHVWDDTVDKYYI